MECGSPSASHVRLKKLFRYAFLWHCEYVVPNEQVKSSITKTVFWGICTIYLFLLT